MPEGTDPVAPAEEPRDPPVNQDWMELENVRGGVDFDALTRRSADTGE